jgi:hypothetical protein
MINRYAGTCELCGGRCAAGAGTLAKHGRTWTVRHLSCDRTGESEVIVTRFSSGAESYRNRNGRCEDAPCCGCCS